MIVKASFATFRGYSELSVTKFCDKNWWQQCSDIFAWPLLCDSSVANGSSTAASRTTTSSHGQSGHTARTARDSELADGDRWHHDSPLARDEMSRHRLIISCNLLDNCN